MSNAPGPTHGPVVHKPGAGVDITFQDTPDDKLRLWTTDADYPLLVLDPQAGIVQFGDGTVPPFPNLDTALQAMLANLDSGNALYTVGGKFRIPIDLATYVQINNTAAVAASELACVGSNVGSLIAIGGTDRPFVIDLYRNGGASFVWPTNILWAGGSPPAYPALHHHTIVGLQFINDRAAAGFRWVEVSRAVDVG